MATVYIVGAGASRDAGMPTIADLRDEPLIRSRLASIRETVAPRSEHVTTEPVLTFLATCRALASSHVSFEESLYAAFATNDTRRYRELLNYYQWVLEVAETYSGVVPIYHDQVSRVIDGLEFGYGYYQLFAYWLLSTTIHSSTVISFNHDLLLEHALEWSGFA